ncbi:murein hydrolase activator EnvC family protein [Niallia endozanthoxylica]|uniref:Peptidoglycan DD-metalloendopeptidase family protein n=1 Tax=Niallia endozanthoxylica TaxID=2036016 RepID=A0A5J5HBN8_9BACI|nr:peptidoglycan DD-metalloendopeptidase family protein [Niallia endozanthoxylica]KAA9018030.1 peptidoglycan DD-metalloendopeptidase family protein [Niallia endozanthoxylica]
MKKTIMILSMAVTVGLGTALTGFPDRIAMAESIGELEKKSKEIQNKKEGIQNELNQTEAQLNEISAEKAQVNAEINRIDLAIGDTTAKITEKNQQIEEKNIEITQLNKEIDVLVERIKARNEVLKDRARSYQESGGMVSYIEVLVGAESFSDFIDRVGAVAVILEADQDILAEHNADKEALEQKQAQVEKELSELEAMRAELAKLQADLNVQKEEKNQLMASLLQEEAQVNELKMSLEEQNENLAAQDSAVQKAIELEQQRQAELKRQREAAAQAAAAQASGPSGSSSSAVSTIPVSDGTFTRPAAGTLTSGFGWRSFNGGGFHYGVDIAKGGSVPIVAAADGVVSRSYSSSSYGETIMITHIIDGQTYTTVYAHLSSRSVGNLTAVSKGQVIGYMGNTGDSYGQHLHFELHRGAWNAAKSNAINPVGIVPL